MGKTNFLARFWVAVYNNATGCLRKGSLPDDTEHLHAISGALLSGIFAGRTTQEEYWHCEIPLVSKVEADFDGMLLVPDCSGEEWKRIYKNREWASGWEDLIPKIWGCLVFIRPNSDKMRTPLDWMTCCKLFGGATGTQLVTNDVPTQVEIVEWLQFLRQAHFARVPMTFRLRVGVVVAAWDALSADKRTLTPDEFLKENLPLLHQFMHANDRDYDCAAFGLSVVGGDLTADEDFRLDYQNKDPHTTGYVIHALGGVRRESPDHTLPVAWAMGLDVSSALTGKTEE